MSKLDLISSLKLVVILTAREKPKSVASVGVLELEGCPCNDWPSQHAGKVT